MLFMLTQAHDFHTSGIACDCIIRSKRAVKDNWTSGMIARNLLWLPLRGRRTNSGIVSQLLYAYTVVWVNLTERGASEDL